MTPMALSSANKVVVIEMLPSCAIRPAPRMVATAEKDSSVMVRVELVKLLKNAKSSHSAESSMPVTKSVEALASAPAPYLSMTIICVPNSVSRDAFATKDTSETTWKMENGNAYYQRTAQLLTPAQQVPILKKLALTASTVKMYSPTARTGGAGEKVAEVAFAMTG